MCEIAVLGLGTNKAFGSLSGQDLLAEACKALSLVLSGMKKSSVYRTKPMYVVDQPDFFNMVVAGEFEGSAADLLLKIHEIEAQFGRNRAKEIRFGQRTLDIDIELFGSQRIYSDLITRIETYWGIYNYEDRKGIFLKMYNYKYHEI